MMTESVISAKMVYLLMDYLSFITCLIKPKVDICFVYDNVNEISDAVGICKRWLIRGFL